MGNNKLEIKRQIFVRNRILIAVAVHHRCIQTKAMKVHDSFILYCAIFVYVRATWLHESEPNAAADAEILHFCFSVNDGRPSHLCALGNVLIDDESRTAFHVLSDRNEIDGRYLIDRDVIIYTKIKIKR